MGQTLPPLQVNKMEGERPPSHSVTTRGLVAGGKSRDRDRVAFRIGLDDAAKKIGKPEGFDILVELVDCYYQLKEQDIEKASALIIRTLEYVYPKMKAIEVSGPDGGPVEIDLQSTSKRFDDLVGGVTYEAIDDLTDDETDGF